uniref:Uncharacterized protein n=1 Tax=viral metagenome TaxID=1070528 RepID=A0A6M3KTV4_9ZZZZ
MFILVLLAGCTPRYIIPDRRDFILDRAECVKEVKYPENDFFIFGPVYILVPVIIGYAVYKYYKDVKLRKCLEAKGYVRE